MEEDLESNYVKITITHSNGRTYTAIVSGDAEAIEIVKGIVNAYLYKNGWKRDREEMGSKIQIFYSKDSSEIIIMLSVPRVEDKVDSRAVDVLKTEIGLAMT